MKLNRKEKSKVDKALTITRMIASFCVVVVSLLQLFEIWDKAINVSVPLIGVVLMLQSIQEWKKNRGVAIFGLGAALFIFVCAIVVWFI